MAEISVFARMIAKNRHFRDLSQQVLFGAFLHISSGNVIDLISLNDVQRIELLQRCTVDSFFVVVQLVIIFAVQLYLIAWQALMGVFFHTASLPYVMAISSVCAKLRRETAKVSDRRISLMNELVSGIRALKTHGWKEYSQEEVKKVRRLISKKY